MSNLFFSKEYLVIKKLNHFLSKKQNQKTECEGIHHLAISNKLVLSLYFIYSTYVGKKQKQLIFHFFWKDINTFISLSYQKCYRVKNAFKLSKRNYYENSFAVKLDANRQYLHYKQHGCRYHLAAY